jgi:integrase/recombinase XerD
METPQQAAAATVRRRMRPTEALRRRLTDAPPLRGVVMKNRIMLQKKIITFILVIYAKIMKWKAKIITHRGESRIAMQISSNPEHWNIARTFEDSRWSQSRKCWHIPNTEENRRRFEIENNPKPQPSVEGLNHLEKFRQWLLSKRYSVNTVKAYSEAVWAFLSFFSDRKIAEITNDDVILFNNEYILKNKLSASYQNQIVNALKLFFRIIAKKEIDPALIHRPKHAKLLPNVLSKAEVKLIIETPRNYKHRTMLSLIYACGLRRSELLNLQFADIYADRNMMMVKQAKGKKDRIVPISDRVIALLRDYYKMYKPKMWLFEGHTPGQQFSPKSLQSVLKVALAKSGIKKPVTLHWLRHSYATHLLESGTDLRYIQELLGHNSSRTTEIYTHVSMSNIQQIRSPFDDL